MDRFNFTSTSIWEIIQSQKKNVNVICLIVFRCSDQFSPSSEYDSIFSVFGEFDFSIDI